MAKIFRLITPFGWILIFLGSMIICLTTVRSGLKYDFGLGFWGPSGHDAIWHISVVNQIAHGLPPPNPVFSGTRLTQYHWGFDLFVFWLNRILPFGIMDLYFRIIPLVFAVAFGFLSYVLAYLLTKKHLCASLFVLLNYLASSFGWIITLIRNHSLSGESLFWSMQSASTLINPPYALSLIFILISLILWQQKRSKNFVWAILIGIILGLLTSIKIYAAIVLGLSFFFFYLVNFFRDKKLFSFEFYLCLSMILTSLAIMLVLGLFSQPPLLVFQPFWFVHSLIESPDKFFLPKLASLRYNLSFQLLSYKLPFFLALEVVLFLIFIVGNLGFRVLGLFPIVKSIRSRNISPPDLLFFLIFAISLLLPTFFIQKGTAWNTIQFFYYFLFLFNFYLAKTLATWYHQNSVLVVFLVALSTIGSIGTLKDYFGYPPPSAIPNYELDSLNFLKQQAPGIILTVPYDKYQKGNQATPLPLYLYETTAYVSALTGFQTYLEDEMNLEITNYDWQTRRRESLKFFEQKDKEVFENLGFLINNNIKYVYLSHPLKVPLNIKNLHLDKIYDNGQSQVYRVQR